MMEIEHGEMQCVVGGFGNSAEQQQTTQEQSFDWGSPKQPSGTTGGATSLAAGAQQVLDGLRTKTGG